MNRALDRLSEIAINRDAHTIDRREIIVVVREVYANFLSHKYLPDQLAQYAEDKEMFFAEYDNAGKVTSMRMRDKYRRNYHERLCAQQES